jgi:hypothetical protein
MSLRRVSRIGPLTSGVLSQTAYALAFHVTASLSLPVQLQQYNNNNNNNEHKRK